MLKLYKDNEVLSFIERSLFWEGSISVKYIAANFNLTKESAEQYFKEYLSKYPANIDGALSSDNELFPDDNSFKFEFAENNFDNILKLFAEKNFPFFESLPVLRPLYDKDILKEIIRALNKRNKVLTIRYQSLNSAIPQERKIIPYSIYSVRGRFHLRGYCLARSDFRDFVLSRIISIVDSTDCKGAVVSDIESSEFVIVKVRPHKELSDMQKMCTEMEYGMKNGIKNIKVKKSLLIYLLDELRIGKDYYKPPFTVLELVNDNEILNILKKTNGQYK